MDQQRYDQLVADYNSRNMYSSRGAVYGDPAYRELSEDPTTVPLLIWSIAKGSWDWFMASLLYHHTGATPFSDNKRGVYDAIGRAWIRWGQEHNIL